MVSLGLALCNDSSVTVKGVYVVYGTWLPNLFQKTCYTQFSVRRKIKKLKREWILLIMSLAVPSLQEGRAP